MFFWRRQSRVKSSPGFSTARIGAVIAANLALLAVVGYAFWNEDWRYSLPTPFPEGLIQPPLGSRLALPALIDAVKRNGRPLLLHFANPQCPCTQFSLDHVRRLEQTFGNRVDFVTVLQSDSDLAEARSEFQSMHLRMPVVYDRGAKIGDWVGVYATPQAAILAADGSLYFRGNYNRSRYCSDETSEFVRIALEALVAKRPLPRLPGEATVTYGCPLPRLFRSEADRAAAENIGTPSANPDGEILR
jgi:hypothetical protein